MGTSLWMRAGTKELNVNMQPTVEQAWEPLAHMAMYDYHVMYVNP